MNQPDQDTRKLVPPGLVYLADNITSKQNVLGAPKALKAKWAKDISFNKDRSTIFFAGCGYQFGGELESLMSLLRKIDKSAIGTDNAMNLANLQKRMGLDAAAILRRIAGPQDDGAQPLRDAVKVLNRIGLEPGYLGEDEPCCGGPLYYFGFQERFKKHSQTTYTTLKNFGVKRIISMVPSCTNTLKNTISSGVGEGEIEVRHFAEVVAERVSRLSLKFPKQIKVAYHDPCQLTRYMGLKDEPRAILQAIKGIELVEPVWTNKEYATCCGGGAGFEAVFPELSQILAVNRAKELIETGARIVVTQCPGCIMQLKTGLKEAGAADIEVLDLAQIVAMSLEQ